jgi:peptidoglycan/xylan/chitin deacetylase (PgdA/CDA1 family)
MLCIAVSNYTKTLSVDLIKRIAIAAIIVLVGCGSERSPRLLRRGMVSITFDDGERATFINAAPMLDAAGLKSTNYIISGLVHSSGAVGIPEILDLQARGHEIGSHTRTHPDLTKLTPEQLRSELAGSRQDLHNLGVVSVQTFAYPWGRYNDAVIKSVRDAGYSSARTASPGWNLPGANEFLLRCQVLQNTTTLAEAQDWIDTAIRDRSWLVLLFHGVDDTGHTYSVTPYFFQQVVNYLVERKVPVVTISQGVQALRQDHPSWVLPAFYRSGKLWRSWRKAH